MPLSSPISWRAIRPSCVKTSRPVESMSRRPAGARPRSCCGANRKLGSIAFPVGALLHQHDRRLMAVLGLAADVADRLVQQDGDLPALLALGPGIDLDARIRPDLQPHHGDLAIDPHPALGDPIVRFASRAQPQFGHAFVQSAGGGRRRFGHPPYATRAKTLDRKASRSRMRRPPYSTRMVACASSAASASLTLCRDRPTR